MTVGIDEILAHNASYFQHKEAKISRSIPIKDILLSFKNNTYATHTAYLHSFILSGNEDEYNVHKSKLPAVTFCGEFPSGHAKSKMQRYNNILIIDIDKISDSEMARTRDCLEEESYVFSYWTSPSQRGIKGLVFLSYSTQIFFDDISLYHKHAFNKVKEYFEETHNILLDNSGSDTCRLCFASHDPNLVIKQYVTPFHIEVSSLVLPLVKIGSGKNPSPKRTIKNKVTPTLTFDKRHLNPVGKNNSLQKLEILKIIKYLKKRNFSITQSYDNWYRIALAIANSFSCDLGEKYFLELCRLDGAKHDETASKTLLIYSYDNSRGHTGFSTIVFLAQQNGYKTG